MRCQLNGKTEWKQTVASSLLFSLSVSVSISFNSINVGIAITTKAEQRPFEARNRKVRETFECVSASASVSHIRRRRQQHQNNNGQRQQMNESIAQLALVILFAYKWKFYAELIRFDFLYAVRQLICLSFCVSMIEGTKKQQCTTNKKLIVVNTSKF